MIDLFTGDVTVDDTYNPSGDTYVADAPIIWQNNETGDWNTAISNSNTKSGGDFITSMGNDITSAFKQLTSGVIGVGTSAAKAEVGNMFGNANPTPGNYNTNLANKSLLSQILAPFQSGGQTQLVNANATTSKWTYVAVIGGLAILFFLLLARR